MREGTVRSVRSELVLWFAVSVGLCAVACGGEVTEGSLFEEDPAIETPYAADGDDAADATDAATARRISGKVMLGGSGLSGVAVRLSGAVDKWTTTDALGVYRFGGLSNGAYTVTPRKDGYAFTPPSRRISVNGTSVLGQGFVAAACSFSISGKVFSTYNPAVPNATLNLSGATSKKTTTDSNGNYRFDGLCNGSYMIAPSKGTSGFFPRSIDVTIDGANLAGKDFELDEAG